jgi:glutathionylspermidine synthase
MQRHRVNPRPDWRRIVEAQGMHFHTIDDAVYWDETACYEFRADEIDLIERATHDLDQMCLEAVEYIIENNLFSMFQIPDRFVPYLMQSWDHDEHTIYGRFDLSYDGSGPPKLLEYNADTPTALLEASVIQWSWSLGQPLGPGYDQFNLIHERLIEAWGAASEEIQGRTVAFASLEDNLEDYMTTCYLRDTAIQAGLDTHSIDMSRIGWNEHWHRFVDDFDRPIECAFKLYPWEWMIREEFAEHLLWNTTRWFEPPWKMLLSNKALLPILHDLYPDSPYIPVASFEPFGDTFVVKPILAREGANIRIVNRGRIIAETHGPYADSPCIYQEFAPLPDFGGVYPVLGSWIVNGHACGLGVREDRGTITQNTSRFVPHLFKI